MYRLAWLTDVHLNFLRPKQLADFCRTLSAQEADGFVITGDIAEAHNLDNYLITLARVLERPIYFVLGNHDFYRSSVAVVRGRMAQLSAENAYLRWLPQVGVVPLTPSVALVGHDGWADGRSGDYLASTVRLNDSWLIEDLAGITDADRLVRLNQLGDDAATHATAILPQALAQHKHVTFATHVPPFPEAAWFNGRVSGLDWQPHVVCVALGKVLRATMQDHPQRQLTVLCGHVHGSGTAQPLPNLTVLTGGAEYGQPTVQRIFTFE